MRHTYLFLVGAILIPQFVLAQESGRRPLMAYVEVRSGRPPGATARLVREAPSGIVDQVVDSVAVDTAGFVIFRFYPETNAWYRIECGQSVLGYGCFALGDSLILQERVNARRLFPIFDKIGAYREQFALEDSVSLDWAALRDTTCEGISNFLNSIRNREYFVQSLVAKLQTNYPEHACLIRYTRRWATLLETYGRSLLAYELRAATSDGCRAPTLMWLDTTSLGAVEDDGLNCMLPYGIVSSVLEARFSRLYPGRPKAAAVGPLGLEAKFRLASQMRGFARAIAYDYLTEIAVRDAPVSYAASLLNRMTDTMKSLNASAHLRFGIMRAKSCLESRIPGSPAQDCSLTDASGRVHALSEFAGKAVILHFWGTWCPPCMRKIQQVRSFERNYRSDSNVVFVNIALEDYSQARWREVLAQNSLDGFEVYSEGVMQSDIAQKYGIEQLGVPSYVIISKDARIVSAGTGFDTSEQFEEDILRAEGR